MNQNTGKYLKYAIGEIFLVMVGILLAVQVNELNQQRKARTEEITLLDNLRGDLYADTLELNYNLEMHKKYYHAEEALLYFLQSEQPFQKDTLEFSDALNAPLLIVLHNSTFNNIRNNEAGLISNNDLRNSIFRFYDFFNRILPVIENESTFHQLYSATKPYFLKYFKLKKIKNSVGSDDSTSDEYVDQLFEKHALEFTKPGEARKDEGFKIELGESIYFRQIKISVYLAVLDRIHKLTDQIDLELKNLK